MASSNSFLPLDQLPRDILLEIRDWVAKHKGRKEGQYNALVALSMTNKNFRAICTPTLLRSIVVGGRGRQRDLIEEGLEDLLAYPNNTRFTTDLRMKQKWGASMSTNTFESLVKLLEGMPKLGRLLLSLPSLGENAGQQRQLQDMLKDRDLVLNNLRTLVIRSECRHLIHHCPQLKVLKYMFWGSESNIDAVALFLRETRHTNTVLDIEIPVWTPRLLEVLLEVKPELEGLSIVKNDYAPQWSDLGNTEPIGRLGFEELLPLVARFGNLRRLAIPRVPDLNTGFQRPSENSRRESKDRRLEINQDHANAGCVLAERLFDACAKLEELWIGADDSWPKKMLISNGMRWNRDLDVDWGPGKDITHPAVQASLLF